MVGCASSRTEAQLDKLSVKITTRLLFPDVRENLKQYMRFLLSMRESLSAG